VGGRGEHGEVPHLYRGEFRVCFQVESWPMNRDMSDGSGPGSRRKVR
jgi:hypothetical protein